MRVAVTRESAAGERRVAVVPASVKRLTEAGLEVSVEAGAGSAAGFADDAYVEAGAQVRDGAAEDADVLLSVNPADISQVKQLTDAGITISFLPTGQHLGMVAAVRDSGRTALAMELVPRISRAQSMDALSSQAMVAGYRAALVAAERLPRFFPMSMTAAGTIPPATVLVVGAGVAGLQAIATVRRLGAIVRAYDVRTAAAEEVRSVGAEFIDLDLPPLDADGGYAREAGEERTRLQQERLTPHVARADALITTAAVPGRPAPLVVNRAMVEAMRPGSVVVDLAAESGGNVEGSVPGEEVMVGGVRIWGGSNVPSQMAGQASQLYANNVVNLLLLLTADGVVRLDLQDEITAGCCVVHAGDVRHARTRELLAAEEA